MPWTEDSLNPADDPTESNWLKEAKAALRARDPGDAADKALCGIIENLCGWFRVRAQARGSEPGLNRTEKCSDAEALARWADRHCQDILHASRAEERMRFYSGYCDED